MRQSILNEILNGTLTSHTIDWVNRCVKYGGTKPSHKSIIAVDQYIKDLKRSNLLDRMKILVGFVPDNLIASVTPIYKTVGSDTPTINAFSEGDLTVNGLKGNGSSKYLSNTGWYPNATFTQTNGGMTVSYTEYNGAAEAELGTWVDNSYTSGAYILAYSGTFYMDMWDASSGRIFRALPSTNWCGFMSGNRTSINSAKFYIANSTTAHQTYMNNTNTITTYPSSRLSPYFASDNSGTIGFYSSKRVSLIGIHDGLTDSDNKTFYELTTLYRQRLGGGFI